MSSEKIRIGILGAGFMGNAHAECYATMPDVELVMVSSRPENQARNLAEKLNIPHWYKDWGEVVSSNSVDAIDIVLPNHLHKEVALACVDEGKPFLIEKPLARNVEEASAICKAVAEKHITAVYGENLRYSAIFQKAKSIVEMGGIGKPILVRVNEIHGGPSHADWFWDASLCGGGAALDMGIHGIFVMEWLMESQIKEVVGMTDVLKWHELCVNGTEDTALGILQFQNGALGEILNAWVVSGGIDVRFEVFGTEGSIHIDEAKAGSIRVFSSPGYGPPIEIQEKERPHPEPNIGWSYPKADEWELSGHKNELRHFVDCVKHGINPISTLEQGLSALAVIQSIYQSAKTGTRTQVSRPNIYDD